MEAVAGAVGGAGVAEVVVLGLVSSTTGGRTGSTLLAGGEALGKLAVESVGELVVGFGLGGGVPDAFEVC